MSGGISTQIKNRIQEAEDGSIFMTSDFADIATITTVRKCLGRLAEDKRIRRVMDGIYEKPRYSTLLEDFLPTDPEKVAYAIARNYHWTISPSGDIALNKLGLSTQVPTVWSYISDGPYREFAWDNIRLKYKHKTNREISLLSESTILVVEAIRTLGKERIDSQVISILRGRIPEKEKEKLLCEGTACSEWIFEVIRKVCE